MLGEERSAKDWRQVVAPAPVVEEERAVLPLRGDQERARGLLGRLEMAAIRPEQKPGRRPRRQPGRTDRRHHEGMSSTRAAAWGTIIALGVSGCGGDAEYEREDGPRVPARLARELPTDSLALAGDFCPEDGGLRGRRAGQALSRARKQLDALREAMQGNPNALVKTRYYSSDEPPGGHEDLTVRELTRRQLDGARELPLADELSVCQPRIRQLRQTLQGLLRPS